MGDIGCFSTYVAHLLVTGVGGLNTTNNTEYAIGLRSLINHGRDSIYLSIDDDDNKTREELKILTARRFSFVSFGHSFRATELEAALGVAQLDERETIITKRRANAQWLTRMLEPYTDRIQLPTIRPECEHSVMMYPIVVRDHSKTELVDYLEEHGVETRDMLPLINQPVYQRHFQIKESDYPVAQWVNQSRFYIGCHQDLSETDLTYIAELFARFWKPRIHPEPRRHALLVILVEEYSSEVEHELEALPVELFDSVIGLLDDRANALKEVFGKFNIATHRLINQNAFHTLNSLDLVYKHTVIFPAGGSYEARDIAKLLFSLENDVDMVVTSRFLTGDQRYDREYRLRYRSLGNRIFSLMANLLYYGNLTDTVCKFRAVKQHVIERAVSPFSNSVAFLYQLSVQSMKEKWRVTEIPTTERVHPSTTTLWQVWSSVIPMGWILFREWFGSQAKREKRRKESA